MMSDSDIADRLGDNIALEYVRDSPLFRQQLHAFEESGSGIAGYARGVQAALKEYESAIVVLQAAQTKMADALLGKTGNYKRCLFTNAFPHLGTLTNTLHEVSNSFHELNGHFEDLKVNLSESVGDLMTQLVASDPLDGKTTKRKMEKSADAFESKLIGSLSNRKPLSSSEVSELCDLRMESELARYDLVEKLNICNCSKKWLLSKTAASIVDIFKTFSRNSEHLFNQKTLILNPIITVLEEKPDTMREQQQLWERVRARLKGELMGSMAAPGSPPGALAPVQPRPHQGMPPYSSVLSTEVLSNHTRHATFNDVRHATDEGVFKQGFLIVKSGVFGGKKRKWHRLYSTSMFVSDALSSSATTMDKVCDIAGCDVAAKPGDVPYVFIVCNKHGTRFEFQAESEDSMVNWIAAVRRCAVSKPGRHTEGNGGGTLANARQQQEAGEELRDVESVTTVLSSPSASDTEEEALLKKFVERNSCCAECNAQPVTWISTSLGITLCQRCSTVHMQLSWAISKLKNIELDEFSVWQLNMLYQELGNERVNGIWEVDIPAGWDKPTHRSSMEDRAKWIIAKYRWYGFVDEVSIRSDMELLETINNAISTGSVLKVMYAVSLKAQANCFDPATLESPLHLAVSLRQPNIFGYLLLVPKTSTL